MVFLIYYELFDDMDMMFSLCPAPQNLLNLNLGDIMVANFVSLVHWVVVRNGLLCYLHLLYLSHLLNAVGEDVSDDDPLLRRRPKVHLNQDDVVEQHQVAHICHLRKNNSRGKSAGTHLWCLCAFPHKANCTTSKQFNSFCANKLARRAFV